MLAFRVRVHSLTVQMRSLEDVQRDAALVSTPSPLRVESPCLLVLLDVYSLVELLQVVLFPPVLGVFELTIGILRYELPSAQISE